MLAKEPETTQIEAGKVIQINRKKDDNYQVSSKHWVPF